VKHFIGVTTLLKSILSLPPAARGMEQQWAVVEPFLFNPIDSSFVDQREEISTFGLTNIELKAAVMKTSRVCFLMAN
jgi:hypothetical protein